MPRTHPFLYLLRYSVALLILAACENAQNTQPVGYCAATLTPAVIVTPEDSSTRANLVMGARGVARSGTYSDSLRRVDLVDSVLWGGARLGTYEVTVERQGYQPWTRSGVQVTQRTVCGALVSVQVTALLQLSP
jgi:hypothetical protein